MQKLVFITASGAHYIHEWDCNENHQMFDAQEWVEAFGDRIGSGVAPLPNGGRINLSEFSIVEIAQA